MSEFPDNFDYVIYGTGIVESILSAALSTTGNNVLHLDKNEYYGCCSGCLRLSELERVLEKWRVSEYVESNDNIFNESDNFVKHVNCHWNVKKENIDLNGSEPPLSLQDNWTEHSLRQCMRGFEFELFPRLLFSESRTIDALIQSDVTRYLEFKFISKFATLSDNKIIPIPINRSDIVKTKVFSLRQKRQLSSFLEWCFTVDLSDETIMKYANRPLFELMRVEKSIDRFTEKIIIECMALSSENVETKEGISRIKRLLHSFNKFGPYPIMWPNYGCGEIPQAFCRMSAVFGAVYSLNTSIVSCRSQLTQNGEHIPPEDTRTQIPTNYRKLKLTLSNNSTVYTDKVISHKSCVDAKFIDNINQMKWISRAIFVTNKSLISGNRDHNDILMLPFHLDQVDKPAILLEFPTDNTRTKPKEDLYIVHLTVFTESVSDSREILQNYITNIFEKYNESSPSLKPQILFECYFTLPDFSDISIDLKSNNVVDHLVFVNNSANDFEFDECVKEANDCFRNLWPGVEFLPRPPNPEDIIQLEQEAVSFTNRISGDFPFATTFVQQSSEHLDAPGDAINPTSSDHNDDYVGMEGPSLSGLLDEIELNANVSEFDNSN